MKRRYRSSVRSFKIRKADTFYVPDDEDLGMVMSQAITLIGEHQRNILMVAFEIYDMDAAIFIDLLFS